MHIMLDTVISVVSLAIIGFYTWSLNNHFSSPGMTTGAKLISAGVVLTALLFLYLHWAHQQLIWAQMLGLAIEIGAAALFWWAIWASRRARLRFAFDPTLPHGIVSEGPYRYMRHPFYSSYLMFWSGWAIASWSVWTVIPVIFFATVYIFAARMEERNFEASPLAEDYRRYKSTTGFFTPRLPFE